MAEQYDLVLEKGALFERRIEWQNADGTPRSLAGLQARMHVRAKAADDAPVLGLTSENGGLVLEPNAAAGQINLRITAPQTDALTIKAGVYDLEIYSPTDPDTVYRLLQGKVSVDGNVTR